MVPVLPWFLFFCSGSRCCCCCSRVVVQPNVTQPQDVFDIVMPDFAVISHSFSKTDTFWFAKHLSADNRHV